VNQTITAVPGIEVGHWTNREAMTGCTVVVLPEPNTVTGEARGGAPGSREFALLQPGMSVEQAQAIVLTGGSAFGLATADGVVRALEADGRGYETAAGIRVPIVPAAVIFDFAAGDPSARPGADEGAAAYRAASADPVETGLVGAGTGATVAKWRGLEHMQPGGIGSALVETGEARVGALAVVNAVGDVFGVDGESLTGGDPVPGPPNLAPTAVSNTTLVVVATDAGLSRIDLSRLVIRSHDALSVCIRPVHTRYDGDAVLVASVGAVEAELDALGEAVFAVTAEAIENAIRSTRR
jgi:L-aminopeptidase/D-esterase-like protein